MGKMKGTMGYKQCNVFHLKRLEFQTHMVRWLPPVNLPKMSCSDTGHREPIYCIQHLNNVAKPAGKGLLQRGKLSSVLEEARSGPEGNKYFLTVCREVKEYEMKNQMNGLFCQISALSKPAIFC